MTETSDVSAEEARRAHLSETLQFCPGCFADEESGSCNHVVVGDLCTNCGANGTVSLPRWAIESIRKNASWVGKRYYPSEEDFERAEERADLLELVTEFPGRSAEYRPAKGNGREYDRPYWWITQLLPVGAGRPVSVSTQMDALMTTAEEAMRRVSLRYVPAKRLTKAEGEGT
jgi:hypothetical protein